MITLDRASRPDGFDPEKWCSFPRTEAMDKEVELLDVIKLHHCPQLREARISWGRTWSLDADGWMPVIRPEFV